MKAFDKPFALVLFQYSQNSKAQMLAFISVLILWKVSSFPYLIWAVDSENNLILARLHRSTLRQKLRKEPFFIDFIEFFG